MKPIDEILRQYAGEFKNCHAAVTLFNYLQQQKEKYGNPTFTPLKEAFDVTWDVNARLEDYPGKIGPQPYPNEILTCKTQEGIWAKGILEEGLDFLSTH